MSFNDYGSDYFNDRRHTRNLDSYRDDVQFIKKNIPFTKNILDYGCGEMIFTSFLKQVADNVYVYDVSQYVQRQYKYNTEFIPDSCDLKYDAIVLRGVLQHLDKPFSSLQHLINNKLNANGFLIFLSTPNTNSPYYFLNKTLPPLDCRLNYWVTSHHEITRVLKYQYNCNLVARYFPYLSSGYAKPLRDHSLFLLNCFGFKSKYPFWYSISNLIYQKRA